MTKCAGCDEDFPDVELEEIDGEGSKLCGNCMWASYPLDETKNEIPEKGGV